MVDEKYSSKTRDQTNDQALEHNDSKNQKTILETSTEHFAAAAEETTADPVESQYSATATAAASVITQPIEQPR